MSIPNIKFKTEYCNSWKEGRLCEKNIGCFFAHGEKQLRTIQQNHKDITMQNSLVSLQSKPHNYKTIFCKFYREGTCKLGEHCTYAHQRRVKVGKRGSQDYTEQQDVGVSSSWDNYQLYQYYAQTYMYNYLQPTYNYDPQIYSSIQVQSQDLMAKEEQNNRVIQNSNELNNISQEITFNHPTQTKNLAEAAKENALGNEQKEQKP